MWDLFRELSFWFLMASPMMAGFKKNNPGCKCCGTGCTFFSDDFAVDDLATNYTSVSGSWAISGGNLHTASSSAVLTGSTANPNSDPNTKISVTVNIATNGDTARIILARVDANNYCYAEVKAGTVAYLKIFQVAGGGAAIEEVSCSGFSRATGTFSFCASIYNGIMRANVGSDAVTFAATFTGTGWGLGTGTLITGTVTFDDLTANITSASCAECGGSSCGSASGDCNGCVAGTVPGVMRVHFRAGTMGNQGCGTCTSLNGTDVDCTQIAGGIGVNCTYHAVFSLCSRTYVLEVNTAVSGSDTILTVTLSAATQAFSWFQTYAGTTTVDCGFVSEEVPVGTDSGSDCTLGDSVEVSAV